jgi:hypothetical protein
LKGRKTGLFGRLCATLMQKLVVWFVCLKTSIERSDEAQLTERRAKV